ncbi:ABC-type nitrate/sulfonate/bicarbonate transport system, ATPase component [Paenibacillus sp. yr247]|uniref:ABC transporter ATP-binding protein n=1 Tax=Paenibacillus sp. yr247 TaxID=1761880 RepID=UPI00087FCDE9|nr:ABC transporter ATP-binding protein [Paenibacillus sp. yr247]SDN74301.1 ABC-type nitrate/sulfonate/bicarbonate transport system, ATPase component [Paenibacillus sp. yr247]
MFSGKKQRVSVLSDISLHVKEGEFVSIIGPSGSGKSTLFHIIGGLIAPSSGEVWLDGANVTGTKGLISYMPQQPALFPWRSIESNVALAQEVAGETRTAALSKAREWLQKVGLGGYEQELPHVLSGGMQQRVSFLRALLSPQELMCLDEPFGSLDALTRQDMQAWLLNIWEQNKRSILFVTHSIEEALFLSDRIYVLSNKPAKIIEELVVPFVRPRLEAVMLESKFHELRQHIQGLLRQEITYDKSY